MTPNSTWRLIPRLVKRWPVIGPTINWNGRKIVVRESLSSKGQI